METLGPYQLVKRLGRGGMGIVYLGVHTKTGQQAAVKVLSAPLVEEPGFRSRFDAEIEALRKLNHPGIVRLIAHGQQQGQAYYVMELVDGVSLEEELRRGRHFDWREVVAIGVAMCAALRHAHDRGIVHRDIKPGNILLAADGSVKLSDFGIARLFGEGRLTGPGSVLGTVEYMAPEQAEGRAADHRSDLYSLGCVLYSLLARRPPYRAATLAEMLAMYRTSRPEPIERLAPDIPPGLQTVIARLLEQDPTKRVPNATVLGRQLDEVLDPADAQPATVPNEPPAAEPGVPSAWTMSPSEWCQASEQAHPVERLPATKDLVSPGHVPPADSPDDGTLPPPPDHFTPFTEKVDGSGGWSGGRWSVGLQACLLGAALVAVGFGTWYLLQPPTADGLYERIASRAADGGSESLLAVEDKIDQFLAAFPDDPRAPTLRKYAEEIQLDRLERRFERRAAGLVRGEPLLPMEREYLDALQYARFDRERAIRKLRAILDLYDRADDASGRVAQCLALARRWLERLRDQVERQGSQQAEFVEQRLRRAEELRASDPARARAMCEAVIELFSDKPWAAEWIARAPERFETEYDRAGEGVALCAGLQEPKRGTPQAMNESTNVRPAGFPTARLRRLRYNPAVRRLVRETSLDPSRLVLPLFVRPGRNERREIGSMPGHAQLSPDLLAKEACEAHRLGLGGVLLFGIPAHKDALGSDATSDAGIVAQGIRAIKDAAPDLLVITDVCFCEYTDHGHCGPLSESTGRVDVDNDATLPLLARQSVVHARAGADIVAPSGMMDGMVGAIRRGLDAEGFMHVPVMSYAAKYASGFYGPFREAAESAPQFGDRRSYQMDPAAGTGQAMREIELDLAEGADLVMVKPALPYLDIIAQARRQFPGVPLAAYNVSGEFSMVKAAAQNGWLDEPRIALEILTSIRRAGADIILTYWAKDAARWLAG